MELCYAHCSALTDPEKCSTGEKLMPSWAGRLEMSGRGKTSPHRSRCLEPAQWHRRASPAPKPADPRRRERQWNNWFLSSCEWKQGEGQRKRGGGGEGAGKKERETKKGERQRGKKSTVQCILLDSLSFLSHGMHGPTTRLFQTLLPSCTQIPPSSSLRPRRLDLSSPMHGTPP